MTFYQLLKSGDYKSLQNQYSLAMRLKAAVRILARIRRFNNNYPPIIIYQMGKVGSSSIYHALKSIDIKNPLFHSHSLSDKGIKNALGYFEKAEGENSDVISTLEFNWALKEKIKCNPDVQVKIITLVREPIARNISDLFQNTTVIGDSVLNVKGALDVDAAIKWLNKYFQEYDHETAWDSAWYDMEIKELFGVDIYNEGFDKVNGMGRICRDNVDILLLRLEDLKNNYEYIFSEFLGIKEKVTMHYRNISANKPNSSKYKEVLNRFRLPRSVCDYMYEDRHIKHFYTESMIQDFKDKWSIGEP